MLSSTSNKGSLCREKRDSFPKSHKKHTFSLTSGGITVSHAQVFVLSYPGFEILVSKFSAATTKVNKVFVCVFA